MEKFVVSRDDNIYEAWPDLTMARDGRLICIFMECVHHRDRSYTRIMLTDSIDNGSSWSPKRPFSESTEGRNYYYNCPRISTLKGGRLAITVDRFYHENNGFYPNYLYFSDDNGVSWSDAVEIPVQGIVPDKLLELSNGRWIIAAHYPDPASGKLVQRCWYSDNQGGDWNGPVIIGKSDELNLCEASILPLGDKLVAFMRENSGKGYDCVKAISDDCGETWGELIKFPVQGCHRPVALQLKSGEILIAHRYKSGKGGAGSGAHNFFIALCDAESALAGTRNEASVRILPVDYDRSPVSDIGYSGMVQLADGEIYIVNYIVDDAPKAQIRGYRLKMEDFLLS
ncbi:MAG: sialidase family protein [Victivallales bacterium]